MDLRTGKTYETREAALADGVPESDLAHVDQQPAGNKPIVKFSKGSFKSFIRTPDGELVRVS